jgi:predicted ATPase
VTDQADPPRIAEFVITGGSCAGKTKSLPMLASALRSRGVRVITIPEVPTMIINGAHPDIGDVARANADEYCRFQSEVFVIHRFLRERAREYAKGFGDDLVVLLFDRGELDGLAYHNHDCFERHAREAGTTLAQIRDSYTAVFHMVTTANGAEDFYNNFNNSARWDNAEEARAFDAKVLRSWEGHPQHVIIDNRTDWQGKLNRLIDATLAAVGRDQQLQFDVTVRADDLDAQELELNLDADNDVDISGVTMKASSRMAV